MLYNVNNLRGYNELKCYKEIKIQMTKQNAKTEIKVL